MHPEIVRLLQEAEDRYLQPSEVEIFQRYTASLNRRLEVYEKLREKEEMIFQPVADAIETAFANEKPEVISRSLKHWILILRYCATAMLANDPEFLKLRLQEWVKGLIEAQASTEIELKIYELLENQLKSHLSEKQLPLIQPFLAKSKELIFTDD
ncbi:phycobilisome protein [[Phormidium] sp. ETS-05]|uniref:phycobilisome protein n=1 Tax=[Phormidium] sp. ETS-05 TaxID=222819 RepID=UPI0018EF30A3|nr:phycobilisome protein [[Phormidium] sp. ETS-05]